MAYAIPLGRVYFQSGPMNCWFYAAKTIIHCLTGRVLLEADYLGGSQPGRVPVFLGRGAGVPNWLTHGLPPSSIGEFASRFQFEQPANLPATWTTAALETTLRAHGPLWFGGHNGQFNHVVVVSGVDDQSNVIYGDPWTGNVAVATLDEFNAWKQQQLGLRNPLYYRGH